MFQQIVCMREQNQRVRDWLYDIIKGATKLYFIHYSCMVFILLITDLCKSVFSTYPFQKTSFLFFCVAFLSLDLL